MVPYVVDTNFFIQAHRSSFPLDVAKSFWNKVKKLAEEEKIISIDKVKKEIYNNEDALKQWCADNLPKDFFKSSSDVMAEYGKITAWAISKSSQYLPMALAEFLGADEADAWLVSFALKNNITVVTQEVSAPLGKAKIKIPDVCNQFGVSFINTIEMFRQLGEHF